MAGVPNVSDWASARRLFAGGGLSVVLPCHRLAGTVGEGLARLAALLAPQGFPYELIPVDDGSADATGEALVAFAKGHPSVRPLLLGRNHGKGAAFMAALGWTRHAWVLLLDGDLDLSPETLPAFCDVAESTSADIVAGSKRHPLSQVRYPWRRRFASACYHALTARLLGLGLGDTQAGMKLFRREALEYARGRMLVKRFAFDLELLAIARDGGFTVAEAPVRVAFGAQRWGCLSWSVAWRTLVDTAAIVYRARVLRYYAALIPLPPVPVRGCGPRFSVIVACPGDSVVLRRLIGALMCQTYRNFEVIFLPDRLLVRPEANYRFRILATGGVRPAKKRNMGALAATGDILAFIDDDAYPAPDWLANAAARFASEPDIAALGGPGLTAADVRPASLLSVLFFASPLVSGYFRYRYFVQGPLRKVEDFPSCNLFVRKTAFEAVRGFREDFWPGEDTLLCADLQRAGHALWYDPRIVVWHHRRPVYGPHLRQVGRYALHRGYFARRIGLNSRRLSYLLPSLFVLGLLLGAPLACLSLWLAVPYVAVVALYLSVTLADALLEAPSLRVVLPLWFGIVSTHLWYGLRFLQGLLARRMPCGVLPFDHR